MNQMNFFYEKYTWLIILKEINYRRAFDTIRNLPLRLDTDLTISIVKENSVEFNMKNSIATAFNTKTNISVKENVVTSFENYLNEKNEKIGILVKNEESPMEIQPIFEIQQIYKIRTLNNKSCVVNELGVYTTNGFHILDFLNVEKRTNFHYENFRISTVRNTDIQKIVLSELITIAPVHDVIINYLIESFNATLQENIYDVYETENDSLNIGLYASIAADLSDIGLATLQITKEKIPFMDTTLDIIKK